MLRKKGNKKGIKEKKKKVKILKSGKPELVLIPAPDKKTIFLDSLIKF